MAQLNDLLSNITNIKNDIRQAIINKGQTVTNFASYPNAILNIQAGGYDGDILLFSNLNEMNNYSNANLGDLALVYDINTNNLQALWQYDNGWNLAPTGLTATNEYVDSAIFWGANGIDQGTLQITDNLSTDQVKIKAQVYSDLSELTLGPEVTDLSHMYNSDLNITTIPSFSGNYVTDCYGIFENCRNLKYVGNLSFPNCESFRAAFTMCSNLTTFPIKPDTFKNDTQYRYMYNSCPNITENITNINVSNCEFTITFNMVGSYSLSNITLNNCIINAGFANLYNLTSVNGFHLENCSKFRDLFMGCRNLVDITDFYINGASEVTNLSRAFRNCNNLSNDSYNVIANGLPNADILTNKYLADTGLNINRFSAEALTILNIKGYVDAIPITPQNYYEIQYE